MASGAAAASGSNPPKRWPCRVGAALEIGPVRLRNLNHSARHSGARLRVYSSHHCTPRDTLRSLPAFI